ncbi:GAP family protein [Haloarcula salinisoli]|uniref:GAP family protein n=1 Tax=Haloarcula salinisoli TaxID=2487746 RepID=A0A8J7YQ62_9EURY|nr:GAP family protein [Halomicroarcula salinisoli]MBX0288374.1 GAP family protein [Halomicroarcula salinisoli]MBX0305856.1 GAP family protein [Halomicroarcula salinisoli]
MSLLTVLPLAVVMVAGPQFLSAIFLATSDQWRRNSAAYVTGAALAISLVVAAAYFLATGTRSAGASNTSLTWVVLVVLLVVAVNVYRTRETAEPPAWMGKLTGANPRFSFRLGFLLLGFFPTDLLTSIAVGTSLSSEGAPLVDAAGFLFVTLGLLALPSLTVLALGERAERFLPKARDWMTDNAWVVNEFVIGIFIVLTLT